MKSLLFLRIFLQKKNINRHKNKIDTNIETKILNSKYINRKVDKTNEHKVPDQVLFGLILGEIFGPFNNFPKRKAVLSLKKERAIIK